MKLATDHDHPALSRARGEPARLRVLGHSLRDRSASDRGASSSADRLGRVGKIDPLEARQTTTHDEHPGAGGPAGRTRKIDTTIGRLRSLRQRASQELLGSALPFAGTEEGHERQRGHEVRETQQRQALISDVPLPANPQVSESGAAVHGAPPATQHAVAASQSRTDDLGFIAMGLLFLAAVML